MTRLNLNDARCEALFASVLQRSDSPTAERAAEAIRRAVRQFGTRGCAGQIAQEFGDHPEAAADRMRWVRQLVAATARPASLGPEPLADPRSWPPPGHDSARRRGGDERDV